MNYGMPGIPDIPASLPIYGYGSYHRRAKRISKPVLIINKISAQANTGEWLLSLITFFTLGVATFSVESARWISSQISLLFVLFLAVSSTYILVKVRIPRWIKVLCTSGLLTLMMLWQTNRLSGGRSIIQILSFDPNQNSVYFAVFLVFVIWVAGVLSIWLVIQRRNAWIPAGSGAIIVLINLSNLPSDKYIILPVYLGIALFLVGINQLTQDRLRLSINGSRYSRRAVMLFVVSVTVFAMIASMSAWFIPVKGINNIGIDINGHYLREMQDNWFNIFASIQSKWNTLINADLRKLSFDAPLDNRTTILFTVKSPQPAYWRIKQYSDYGQRGWSNSYIETGRTIEPGDKADLEKTWKNIREINYTVETDSKTDLLLLTGEFVSSDIPVQLERHQPLTSQGIQDITSVTTTRLLQPHQVYIVNVNISTASPAQLTEAGSNYPDWIVQRYLQLPDTLPFQVKDLASTVTDNTSNAYDKAVAVQKYLNGFKYNKDAKSPSRLGDETSVFLFEQKEGVCTDFATAMVIMLRSLGIPARLATGYVSGEINEETGSYIVRGRDYHAWPEVYFPDFGWIVFEPTPGSIVETDISSSNNDNSYFNPYPYGLIDSGEGPITGSNSAINSKKGHNYILPIVFGMLLLFATGGILWVFGSRAYRNLRYSGDVVQVYDKMCRLASFGGVPPSSTETPFEYTKRLIEIVPNVASSIINITSLYTESRFSPRKDITEYDLARLQRSWIELYPILFKRRLPWNK
jgi:hypothetical protein